jgi:hypothetical protein
MGRPIKKKSIGNSQLGGNQITATAIIPGNAQVFTDAYIVSQKGTGRYVMTSPTTTASGLVSLVNGVVSTAGQANVVVTPWGAHGSGATVTANVGINTVSINLAGGGAVGTSYTPGSVLDLVGGTYVATSGANVSVNSVKVGNATVQTAGTGYASNSYMIFSGTDWSTPANVSVTTVGTVGNIQAISIVNAGVFTGVTLPGTAGLSVAPSSVLGNVGVNATLNFRFDLNSISVSAAGDYSVRPAGNISLTTGVNGGNKANITATWQVTSLRVTAAGSAYDAVNVVFESGAAAATGTLTNGNLTAATVTAGGNYTGVPNVAVQLITSPVYAEVIYNNTVKDFSGNEYAYNLAQTTLTGPGQATIQSS